MTDKKNSLPLPLNLLHIALILNNWARERERPSSNSLLQGLAACENFGADLWSYGFNSMALWGLCLYNAAVGCPGLQQNMSSSSTTVMWHGKETLVEGRLWWRGALPKPHLTQLQCGKSGASANPSQTHTGSLQPPAEESCWHLA